MRLDLRVHGLVFRHHGVAPAPAPGAGVIRFGAAGHFCDDESIRRAEFGRHLDLADDGLRQHAGGTCRDWGPRQRHIAEFFVLEGKLGFLDPLVRARPGQPLREVAPVGRLNRAFAVVRAGGCDMRARRDQLLA